MNNTIPKLKVFKNHFDRDHYKITMNAATEYAKLEFNDTTVGLVLWAIRYKSLKRVEDKMWTEVSALIKYFCDEYWYLTHMQEEACRLSLLYI